MTAFYKAGECIKGERIYVCFGQMNIRPAKKGLKRCTLSLHGFAQVLKPLKRSKSAKSRSSDRIECRSAVGEAKDIDQKAQKVPCGAHRCIEGYLEGKARCEIQAPLENVPGAK